MTRLTHAVSTALVGAALLAGIGVVPPSSAATPTATLLARNSIAATGSTTTSAAGAVLVAGIPMLCDWNGDGRSTVGVYRPTDATWHIRNTPGAGPAEITFRYGSTRTGSVPICGDWNGDRIESPGVYRPSDARWFLRNSMSAGDPDIQFQYGRGAGVDRPIVGDWNGDGIDTPGVYRASTRTWHLRNIVRIGAPTVVVSGGPSSASDVLIAGDPDGDRKDAPGWVSVGRQWQLRSAATSSSALRSFSWGAKADAPLIGDIDGNGRDEPILRRLGTTTGPAQSTAPSPTPLPGLYVDPSSQAVMAAARLRAAGRTSDAAAIDVIATQPQAFWIGDWESTEQVSTRLHRLVSASKAASTTLVIATYAIPMRDCGGYSSGGLTDAAYRTWTAAVAEALRGSGAIVIVEPDALALLTSPACASVATTRPALLAETVRALSAAGARVYLDAGHSNWVPPERMAELLRASGIANARGFATNVSNTNTTASEQAYAERVSALVGGKSYVIDVSRNGRGSTGEWCNPRGAAIGSAPRLVADGGRLDGLLWIKRPGESDGPCNGAPGAGQWWDAGALALVRNR